MSVQTEVVPRVSLTVDEAALAVGVGRTTIRAAIDSGDLPVRWVTKSARPKPVIRLADLEAWVDALPTAKPQPGD